MKAVTIHQYGGSDVLKYEEVPMPVVNDNEVLVKVYAASVNHLDLKKASGALKQIMPLDHPWIPGHDFAGIVESTGPGASGFKEGDAVYGNCPGGSYAEYLAVNASTAAAKPEKLSFVEAASVPHVAETAWQAIHTHGRLRKGENILIHGAAGAVGAYAVQFAHEAGAYIYATASGSDREYLYGLGADVVIDYKTEDFTQTAKDIDLVIDLVGGSSQRDSYKVLKRGGRLVTTVDLSTEEEARRHNAAASKMVIKQSGEDLRIITGLINAGRLKWDVAMTLPLQDASKAWDILSRKNPSLPSITHGKIVLETAW